MAEETKHPDVVVHLTGDTPFVWQEQIYDQLVMATSRRDAEAFMAEVKPYLTYPTEFVSQARRWVTVDGAIDEGALARHAPAYLEGLVGDVGTDGQRWQYAVANIGSFSSPGRMASVLAVAGANGWELIAIYDKASNWFQGFEKGFMLLKRPVAEGETPDEWCVEIRG